MQSEGKLDFVLRRVHGHLGNSRRRGSTMVAIVESKSCSDRSHFCRWVVWVLCWNLVFCLALLLLVLLMTKGITDLCLNCRDEISKKFDSFAQDNYEDCFGFVGADALLGHPENREQNNRNMSKPLGSLRAEVNNY